MERIDYDETFAPVTKLESIRMLWAYACLKHFNLHQMDVKNVFLNGIISEEVYDKQPLRFEDFQNPEFVYRFNNILYGLK